MNNEWLNYLDTLAEKAAKELILSEGTEPENLSIHEAIQDIVEEYELDEDDEGYLVDELPRLIRSAEVKVKLQRYKRLSKKWRDGKKTY